MQSVSPRFLPVLLLLSVLSVQAAERRAEWRFAEGAGAEAADVAGEQPALVSAQWASGTFGTGLYFSEAAHETVAIPDSPAVQFGRDSFALSLWLCPTQLAVNPEGQYRRLLSKSSFPGTFWTLDIFDSGRVMFAMRDSEGVTGTTTSQGAIPEGKWTHLAVVVDRENHRTSYYFDGRLDSQVAFPANFGGALDVPGQTLRISTWRKYIGLLGPLAVWQGAPEAAAIEAEWRAGEATYRDAAFTAVPQPPFTYSVPLPTGEQRQIWDLPALAEPPRTHPAPDFADEGTAEVRALFYEGLPYEGRPTRIFAWYGAPAEREGRVPAMILVHGGGGTVFKSWVETWVGRGYAALAMDTAGGIPRRPEGETRSWQRHEFSGPQGWGDFGNMHKPVTDHWAYHAVAAVILGHSLLRDQPEVDPERIGITGISWGGYLTILAAGTDSRFRFASPVYGCGFLGENSAWVGRIQALEREQAIRLLRLWDPSQFVGYATMPMLFCNGTNDRFFPLDSWQKTYRATKAPRALACRVRMVHSHPPHGDPPEITAYADHLLRGAPAPLRILGQGRDDRMAWAEFAGQAVRAELCYTTATGNWQQRHWEQVPATIAGNRAGATLPEGVTVYFLNLIDEQDRIASSEHEELPAE